MSAASRLRSRTSVQGDPHEAPVTFYAKRPPSVRHKEQLHLALEAERVLVDLCVRAFKSEVCDGKLCGAVARIFVDTVLGWYRRTLRELGVRRTDAFAAVARPAEFSRRRFQESRAHERDGFFELLLHELGGQPKHPVAQAAELSIAARIRLRARCVIRAIDFHDQPTSGRDEVCDEPTGDRNLPTKRRAELAGAKPRPQARF